MRYLTVLLILLASCSVTLAQDHGAPIAGESFGAWMTECFSDGYCSASAESTGDADRLALARHAEGIYWELSYQPVGDLPGEWSDFLLDIDGVSESFLVYSEVGAYGAADAFYFVGPKAQTIMDRLMPGKVVSVTFNDDNEVPQTAGFDLSGLTAALLWIDEQQGRIGSERVAEAPPQGLTPVYPGDVAPAAIPATLLDRHRADPECRPFEDIANGRDFVIDQIDAEHTVYILPCDSWAYNFASKVYLEAFGEIYPQYFADYSETWGWSGTSMVFGSYWDPETNQLGSFYKGRGLGDCGATGLWELFEGNFKLLQFTAKNDCDDAPAEDENIFDFPVIYQAEGYVPPGDATEPNEDKN